MRIEPRYVTVFLLVVRLIQPVFSDENIGEGSLRISDAGAFMLISAPIAGSTEYLPLWDDDPLSSQWILSIDGVQVSPSDENWVRELSENQSTSILEYRNRAFSLRQEWRLLPGSPHAVVTTTFRNSTTAPVRVSMNLLLDTSLGESNGLPVQLDSGEYIRGETTLADLRMPRWIKTVKNVNSPALTVILDGKGISKPERLVVANWRRLKEGGLSFQSVEGRNFDLLPFSRTDSAILIGFREKAVPVGGESSVSIILGLNENPVSPAETGSSQIFSVDEKTENRRLRIYAIRERLTEVNREIEMINRLLEDDQEPERNTVLESENRVEILERRRTEYENL